MYCLCTIVFKDVIFFKEKTLFFQNRLGGGEDAVQYFKLQIFQSCQLYKIQIFLNLDSKHKEGNLDTQNKGEPNQQNKNKISEPVLETAIIETEQKETTYSV